MVMPTTVADLEAVRAHLHAEATRIRSEYETRLPDIEGDLAAVDRLLSRMPTLAGAEPTPDAPAEAAGGEPEVVAPSDAITEPEPAMVVDLAPAAPAALPATRGLRHLSRKRPFDGLTQPLAVIKIAERNGGVVTVPLVARIFVEEGLTRAVGDRAMAHASHILGDFPHFERVRRGVYRLRVQTETTNAEPDEAAPATY
jgi:hypothetical protein